MLKRAAVIKELASRLGDAAHAAAEEVLGARKQKTGREEELTAALRHELNKRLLENIKSSLNEAEINGSRVLVETFRKVQEKQVGADLVGVIEIAGARSISKAFLAQAKVGQVYEGARGEKGAKAYSADLLKQVDDMLSLSSDSFVFIYSDAGLFVIPALQIRLANSKSIDTANHPYRSFGSFFEEFVKCFIGDHKISPDALGVTDLEDYLEELHVEAAFRVQLRLADGAVGD
jgi:hypothetical protein